MIQAGKTFRPAAGGVSNVRSSYGQSLSGAVRPNRAPPQVDGSDPQFRPGYAAGLTAGKVAQAQQNRAGYLGARGLTARGGGGAPDNGGQDWRMVMATGDASARGRMPTSGISYSATGARAWGAAANNTSFNGTTAANGFTLGGAGGPSGGGGGAGSRSPGGGFGGGGAGLGGGPYAGRIGGQLQADQNAANAANEARYGEARDLNANGQAAQQAGLDQNYNNIYGAIQGSQQSQMDFLNNIYGQQQQLTAGLGATAHEQETRRLGRQVGASQQSLVGRGLGNSTVVDSMRRGLETDSAFNQRAIDEDAARVKLGLMGNYGQAGGQILGQAGQQQIGAMGQYAGQTLGVQSQNQAQRIGIIEGRTDAGPNVGQYLNALGQPGAQGGGGGFGGGGGNRGGGFQLNDNGGGGNEGVGDAALQQYLAGLGVGPQQQGGGGGGFQPDPRTVAANARIRAQQQQQQQAGKPYSAGGGGTTNYGGGNATQSHYDPQTDATYLIDSGGEWQWMRDGH